MSTWNETVAGVTVHHDRADLDEIASLQTSDQRSAVQTLLESGVSEAFVLQTCHRAEAYVVTDDNATTMLTDFVSSANDEAVVYLNHEESLRHLIRIAAGLESMVLGEDEVLGQVKTAYEEAKKAGGIGPVLDEALAKAIHTGERARAETEINEGVKSIASAAVIMAARERDLTGATALVVGAGQMGTTAARRISDTEVERIAIANRSIARAEEVTENISTDSRSIGLDALDSAIKAADVVVTATGSSTPLITADMLAAGGDTLVVDLGQPHDVAQKANEIDGVALYDIEALEPITIETNERRQAAAADVEALVDREYQLLLDQYKRKRADAAIATMYESAERMKTRELETVFSKLQARRELSTDEREIIEAFAESMVGQLLAAPTKSLRNAAENDDWSRIVTALQLFDPEFEHESSRPAGRAPETDHSIESAATKSDN